MRRIRVTIDRVVLKGFEAGDRKPLIEGLQAELSRLLVDSANHTEWARSNRTPVLRLGRVPTAAGPAGSRKLGTAIAQALSKGIRR
jgi:hypothetical protein